MKQYPSCWHVKQADLGSVLASMPFLLHFSSPTTGTQRDASFCVTESVPHVFTLHQVHTPSSHFFQLRMLNFHWSLQLQQSHMPNAECPSSDVSGTPLTSLVEAGVPVPLQSAQPFLAACGLPSICSTITSATLIMTSCYRHGACPCKLPKPVQEPLKSTRRKSIGSRLWK